MITMASYQLAAAYEGPKLTHDQDGIDELIPAIFAVAEMIQNLSQIVNPQNLPIKVNVVTGRNLGFYLELTTPDKYTLHNLRRWLRREEMQTVPNFKQLFNVLQNIVDFLTAAGNHPQTKRELLLTNLSQSPETLLADQALVKVEFAKQDPIVTSMIVLRALDDPKFKQSLQAAVKPIATAKADKLDFYTQDSQKFTITKATIEQLLLF